MAGFVAGLDRGQATLLPECLEDWVDENNSVRAVDVFVEALDLRDLGFEGVDAAGIGRPSYRPGVLLKLYIYGYLNRVQSSRRLESEAGRNLEVMWLTGRLAPDHKTIADFRKDNGRAIRKVCARFVELCRKVGLLEGQRCHRRQQVQGREQSRQQLHGGQPAMRRARRGRRSHCAASRNRSAWSEATSASLPSLATRALPSAVPRANACLMRELCT
jgi:transposase